ncbi:LCP family protein [Streptomyces pactum]|uniref:LCP family protein n=1 Tax=Streptomyces pactum TaxID=68249 RepID=A0ABS0NN72_9ACTN|nr:LCP family protein [Streptomyces pactum]MBH5336650.1 LCP family protein [Streptomyces pactum]
MTAGGGSPDATGPAAGTGSGDAGTDSQDTNDTADGTAAPGAASTGPGAPDAGVQDADTSAGAGPDGGAGDPDDADGSAGGGPGPDADAGEGADTAAGEGGAADPGATAPGATAATGPTDPGTTAGGTAADPDASEDPGTARTDAADGDTPPPSSRKPGRRDRRGRPGKGGKGGARPSRRRRVARVLALTAAVLLVAVAGTGWWLYQRLDSNIRTDPVTQRELERHEAERPVAVPVARDARNILLIGSDTRGGKGNSKYGQDSGTQRSDTTILLHLAAGGRSATAVSIPRDLMTEIPACRAADGTDREARFAQFNWAYQFGGAACTIRTVEKMTGIRIDHHMIIDFRGFKRMVDAVDGVEVCLDRPVNDTDAHLRLPAGRQTLYGEEALGYVRARKGIGDGSDTSRMGRQQEFLGSLLKKVRSNGVLLDPRRLFPVLDAATSALTTDPGLGSLRKLYSLTQDIRAVPQDRIRFLTVPRQPYALDPNRDELVQPDAEELFRRLRLDQEVPPAGDDGAEEAAEGTAPGDGGSPTPTGRSVPLSATEAMSTTPPGICEQKGQATT